MNDQKVGGWIQKQDAVELAYAMFSGNDCPYCGQPVGINDAIMSDVGQLLCHSVCWNRHIIEETYGTYTDDEGHTWINAPGACRECLGGGRGQGHFLCGAVPDDILSAYRDGVISPMLHNNAWRWW